MEWHGERQLPRGLPEVMYQATPPEFRDDLVVIATRDLPRGIRGSVRWSHLRQRYIVRLHPWRILSHRGHQCAPSFGWWRESLRVALHEVGHVMMDEYVSDWQLLAYEEDHRVHESVEQLADAWAAAKLAAIARDDPRLGQPIGYPGGVYGVVSRRQAAQMWQADGWGSWRSRYVKDHRAVCSGGQFSCTDVARRVAEVCAGRRYRPDSLAALRRLVRKSAARLGITRAHFDRAGRRHLYLNHGEADAVVADLESTMVATQPCLPDEFPSLDLGEGLREWSLAVPDAA